MTLLFIDDEEDTRKGIEKNVNWEKLGIDTVVSFSNPFKALEYIGEETVDIVLSDIRMPHMDGIKLCQNILERIPTVSIIFISGYSDKEYLMNAIQISAVDYIEKPISILKLEAAIEKAVNRQRNAHSQKQHQENAIEILRTYNQIYMDQLAMALIHGQFPLSEPALTHGGLSLSEADVIPINETDFYRVYLWKAHANILGFRTAIESIRAQLSATDLMPSFFSSQKDEQTCVFIARFPSALACSSCEIDYFLANAMRRERIERTVSCAYGTLQQGASKICESYKQAVIALQNLFFSGYGTILSYQSIHEKSLKAVDEKSGIPVPPLKVLQEGLEKRDRAACIGYLEQVYQVFLCQRTLLPDLVRNEYFKIFSAVDQNALEGTEAIRHPGSDQSGYLWQRVNSLKTLEECHLSAKDKIEQFFGNLSDMVSDKKIIQDVMRLIHENYSDHELYIHKIAGQVYMTPNYLSMLFKRETGKTIGTYITEVRLKHSSWLLSKTNMKLCDIANAVGYTDTNYYSTLFKKHYHISPSEYRNRFSQ